MLDRPAVGTGAAKQAAAAKTSAAAPPAAREHLPADGSVNLRGVEACGVPARSASPAAKEEWAGAGNPQKRNLAVSLGASSPARVEEVTSEKLRPRESAATIKEVWASTTS